MRRNLVDRFFDWSRGEKVHDSALLEFASGHRMRGLDFARVEFRILPNGEGLPLPAYETPLSAGMDLRAAVPAGEVITLQSNEHRLIPTGLALALPAGMEAQVRPRSGLALKFGVTCLNSPGTIDADYRGELGVILINHGSGPFEIKRADRIAQIVFATVTQAEWHVVESLSETARGGGGFGSTGSG